MTDQEILDAIRASGITKEQLTSMLTKNVILVTVEEKRAQLARAAAEADAVRKAIDDEVAGRLAPYQAQIGELAAQLAALEAQAAASL